jgi:hypothetical protein
MKAIRLAIASRALAVDGISQIQMACAKGRRSNEFACTEASSVTSQASIVIPSVAFATVRLLVPNTRNRLCATPLPKPL